MVIADPEGKVFVFAKGADTAILPLIKEKDDPKYRDTVSHLEKFAESGMRTLVFAYRQVRENFDWAEIEDYDPDFFENDFELLGATGVEDKL